jgi:phenylalanyl-tRNA synthetase alpha chain
MEPDKTMKDRIAQIKQDFLAKIAGAADDRTLEEIRVQVMGRSGALTEVLKMLGSLPKEERPAMGSLANETKDFLGAEITKRMSELSSNRFDRLEQEETLDVTLPGRKPATGSFHPITTVMNDLVDIFKRAGFSVVSGPEVETDYYNFEALNMPPAHPARDMQDTFYLENGMLLRTHTSAVQVRIMEKMKPPVAIIAPGKVYRRDSDISHIPMFHQIEGLLIDKKTNFSNLKGVLTFFLQELFGKDLKVRFRPSYFPYTEPSAEVDVQCVSCRGKGCPTCKGSGWLEILGSGMVHPSVFDFVKYDAEEYQGFAFGIGLERVAMLRYGVNDIRNYYQNDVRFLGQFQE